MLKWEQYTYMVWICKECGHGNLDEFTNCINCNVKTTKDTAQLMNCWDYNNCLDEHKTKCVVYNSKMGRECWLFHDIRKGCPGNSNQSCSECDWYSELHQV